jgi:transcriptional regulator with XRE-family HTH domain
MQVDLAKIRRLRKQRGLTLAGAGAPVKISRQRWNDIEQGRAGGKTGITLPTLARVAKALGVKAKDLLK